MKRNKKGFTLVEIIVVLAIIAILMVMVGGSLYAYTKNSKYRKNNDFARSVYTAAQNALSQKKVNGTLEEWFASADVQGAAVEIKPASVTPAASPDGQEDWLQKKFDLVYNSDTTGLTDLEKESLAQLQEDSKLYALVMPKGDKSCELWKLIEDYMPDGFDEGKNGSACVEFNPVTGQVYAAFYSDRILTYSYGSGKLEESGTADPGQKVLRGDADAKRRELMIGYYNVWQVGEPELPEKEESSLQYTLVNGRLRDISGALIRAESSDSLFLKVKLLTLPPAGSAVTYRLVFCDKTGIALGTSVTDPTVKDEMVSELLFTVERKASPGPADDPYEYSGCAYIANAGGSGFTRYPLNVQFVPGHPEQFNVVLDAIDLYATTDRILTGTPDLENIRNTYSVSRFGIPSQDITVKLAEADHGMAGVEPSNAESLYFAQEEQTGLDWEIQLADLRHLYNLRYVSTPDTGLPQALRNNYEAYFQTGGKTVFVQKENLDWKKTTDKKHVFRGAAASMIPAADDSSKDRTDPLLGLPAVVTAVGTAADQAAFPSIPFLPYSLASGGSLKAGSGIYDAGYNAAAEHAAYKIQNLVIAENASGGSSQPAGLFRNVLGQVKNLWLEDVTVEGVDDVGAVAGRNFGILGQDMTLADTAENKGSILVTGSVTGTGTGVGGIAGSDGLPAGAGAAGGVTYLADRSQYNHITSGVVLTRQGAASADGARTGGVVGEVNGAAGSRRIVMTDCRFTDVIIAGTGSAAARRQKAELLSDGSYNGGLAGYVAKGAGIEAENCLYAGNLAYGELDAAARQAYRKGSYTGGLFGFCQGELQLKNCRVSGEAADTNMPADGTAYVVGKNCVGGILGKLDEGARVQIDIESHADPTTGAAVVDSYGAQVRNAASIEGDDFVGGFAGVNTADSLFDASGSLAFLDGIGGVAPGEIKGRNFVGGIFGGNVLKAASSAVIGPNGGEELIAGAVTEVEASGFCAGSFSGLWAAGESGGEKLFLEAASDEAAAETKLETLLEGWSKTGSPYVMRGLKNEAKRIVVKRYAGGIIGYTVKGSHITLDNCVNNGIVAAGKMTKNEMQGDEIKPEGLYAGGLISVNYGTIVDCSNSGMVVGAAQVGGIAGSNGMAGAAAGAAVIRDCVNQGAVMGDLENVGGICGRQAGDDSQVLRSVNRNDVSFVGIAEKTGDEAVRQNLGGIAGLCEAGTLEDVSVQGNGVPGNSANVEISADQVTGPAGAEGKNAIFYRNIGGVVGHYKGKSLKVTSADVNVIASNGQNVGGLIGLAEGTLGTGGAGYSLGENAACYVRGYEQTGGLIGRLGPEADWVSTDGKLQASEQVTVTGRYRDVGGLFGYVEGHDAENGSGETLPAMSMQSAANVNGAAVNMGGLIGHIYYAGTLKITGDHTWIYEGEVTAGDADASSDFSYRYIQERDENGSKIGPGCVGGIAGLMEGPAEEGAARLQLELKDKNSWQANSGLTVYNASCAGSYVGRYLGSGTLKNLAGGNRIRAYYNGWMKDLPAGESAYTQGYLGGLFGHVDLAQIEGCRYEGASCELAVTVDGGEAEAYAAYIGGVTGANGRPVKASVNAGRVTMDYQGDRNAYAGYIGGISGKSYADGVITGCTVEREVSGGARGRFVGGVTGENLSPLDCSNSVQGPVSGDRAIGGYTGANRSLIQDTTDHTAEVLSVNAALNGGGIAGHNMGTITVQNLPQTNVTGNYSGGIAGSNEGNGVIRKFGDGISNDSNLEAVHTVRGLEGLGGIAGENSGTISPDGSKTPETAAMVNSAAGKVYVVWSPKVAVLAQDADHKCVSAGGVTGSNRGLLMNLQFEGLENTTAAGGAKRPLQALDTVGGITALLGAGGRIQNCTNFGELQLLRLYPETVDENGGNTTKPVAAGGIAAAADGGDAQITDCVNAGTFVFPSEYVTDAAKGTVSHPTEDTVHAGGILGNNTGASSTVTISRCRSYATAFTEAADGSRAADREVLRGLYCAPQLGSESKVVFTDSFNFADLRYPVSDMILEGRIGGSAYFFDHHAPQAVSDSESVAEVPNNKDTSGWDEKVKEAAAKWNANNDNYKNRELKTLLREFDKQAKENRNETVYYQANFSLRTQDSKYQWFYDEQHPALAVNGSFKADTDGITRLKLYFGKDRWSGNNLAEPSALVLRADGTVEKLTAKVQTDETLNDTTLMSDAGTKYQVGIFCNEYEIKDTIKQIWLVPGKYEGLDYGNGNVAGMAIYAIDISGQFDPTEVKSYYQGFHAAERQDPSDGKSYYTYINKNAAQVVLADDAPLFATQEVYSGTESWGYNESGKAWKKPARSDGGAVKGLYEIFEPGLSALLMNGAVPNSTDGMKVMRLSVRNILLPQPKLELYRQAGGLKMLLANADLFEAMGLEDWYVHVSVTLEDGTTEEAVFSAGLTDVWFDLTAYDGSVVTICYYLEAGGSAVTLPIYYDVVLQELPEAPAVSGNSVSENTASGNTISDNTVSDNSVSDNQVPGHTVSDNQVPDNTVSGNAGPENPVSDNAASAGNDSEHTVSDDTVSQAPVTDGAAAGGASSAEQSADPSASENTPQYDRASEQIAQESGTLAGSSFGPAAGIPGQGAVSGN